MKIKEFATLLFSFIFVFFAVKTPLEDYLSYIIGIIIIFSIVSVVIRKRQGKEIFLGAHDEVFFLTTAVLLMVFLTDGFESGIFFLTYFLLFGIAFIYTPVMVFVFVLGLIAVFFDLALQEDLFSNIAKLGSLVLLSPIAFFFGNEFRRTRELEDEIEEKTGDILEDADELLHEEPNKNKEVNDIIEKAQDLREKGEE